MAEVVEVGDNYLAGVLGTVVVVAVCRMEVVGRSEVWVVVP